MRTDDATYRTTVRRTVLIATTFAVAFGLPASVPAQAPASGDFMPRATLAEIMESIVMPAADVVWNATAINVTADGVEESAPETDEEWARVRAGAVELEEAANLLVIPGRAVDVPDAQSEAPDVELEPSEIAALMVSNRAAWVGYAHALQATAIQALAAIDARDLDAITEVGGAIDAACESCHTQFWYPE